ncbi:type II toxin-antitoxin system RelE/ParE family toxin [Acerihabitans sp.]|uniref:type II toxin-antitoxin system RelE/ParE family toxin n=1 Tax=Acerihabitans sp. TaxID=2811394 RepID=UPI002ED8F5A0
MEFRFKKQLVWMAGSKKDLSSLPAKVVKSVGYALHLAQAGLTPPDAKPLAGFHGAGVLEIVENHNGDTYRAVYTVKFLHAIFVLHCFQKKSRTGIATPKHDIELIRCRLERARKIYEDMKNGKL